MVMTKIMTVDVKTGEIIIEDKDIVLLPVVPMPNKGIDFERLKQVLINKDIITDSSEIESIP